jgi:hypothetical protein
MSSGVAVVFWWVQEPSLSLELLDCLLFSERIRGPHIAFTHCFAAGDQPPPGLGHPGPPSSFDLSTATCGISMAMVFHTGIAAVLTTMARNATGEVAAAATAVMRRSPL